MTAKPNPRRWDHRRLPGSLIPALRSERARLQTEPILVPIACAGCLCHLAEVAPGGEAWCPRCHRWTSTFDTIAEGA